MSYTGSYGNDNGGGGGGYNYSPPPSPPSYSPPSYSSGGQNEITFGGYENRRPTPSPPPSPKYTYHEDAQVTLGGYEERREPGGSSGGGGGGGEVIILHDSRKSSSSSDTSVKIKMKTNNKNYHKHRNRPHRPHTSSVSTEVDCNCNVFWICVGIVLTVIGVIILLMVGAAMDPKPKDKSSISKPPVPRVPTLTTKKPPQYKPSFYDGSYYQVEASFSPASLSKNLSSLAFAVAQQEERVKIERNPKYSDIFTLKSRPKGAAEYKKEVTFQVGKPFPMTEDDEFHVRRTFNSTVEIDDGSKTWVETQNRRPRKVTIERHFTDTGMTVYYSYNKVIYVKKFKRKSS